MYSDGEFDGNGGFVAISGHVKLAAHVPRCSSGT